MTSPLGAPRPIRAHAGTVEFRAIVDAAEPPRPGLTNDRPMCAAWDDHQRRSGAIRWDPTGALEVARSPLPPEVHCWFPLGWAPRG